MKTELGESGRCARLRLRAAPGIDRGEPLERSGNANEDERKSRLPGRLDGERSTEELTQAAVRGMNARARRG